MSIDPQTVRVDVAYDIDPQENTFRTQAVKDAYGIDFETGEQTIIDGVSIDVEPRQIVYATGASGAGKTSFCREVAREIDAVDFDDVTFPRDCAVVDAFPEAMDVQETQMFMAMFGLGDAHLNLRRYDELSEGQKYRAKLAYCAATEDAIFADEYCATLDRTTAKTISFSIRKALDKSRLDTVFLFATTHRDVLEDLNPDWLLDFDENEVVQGRPRLAGGNPVKDDDGVLERERKSRSRIVSNSPAPPKRTGRSSLGGITSGTESA